METNNAVGRTVYGVQGSSVSPISPPPSQTSESTSDAIYHVVSQPRAPNTQPNPQPKKSRLSKELKALGGQTTDAPRRRIKSTVLTWDKDGPVAICAQAFKNADILKPQEINDLGIAGSMTVDLPIVERKKRINEAKREKKAALDHAKKQRTKELARMLAAADSTRHDEEEEEEMEILSRKRQRLSDIVLRSILGRDLVDDIKKKEKEEEEESSPKPNPTPAPPPPPKVSAERMLVEKLDKDKVERFERQTARVMRLVSMAGIASASSSSSAPSKKLKFASGLHKLGGTIDIKELDVEEIAEVVGPNGFDRELHEWGLRMNLTKM